MSIVAISSGCKDEVTGRALVEVWAFEIVAGPSVPTCETEGRMVASLSSFEILDFLGGDISFLSGEEGFEVGNFVIVESEGLCGETPGNKTQKIFVLKLEIYMTAIEYTFLSSWKRR